MLLDSHLHIPFIPWQSMKFKLIIPTNSSGHLLCSIASNKTSMVSNSSFQPFLNMWPTGQTYACIPLLIYTMCVGTYVNLCHPIRSTIKHTWTRIIKEIINIKCRTLYLNDNILFPQPMMELILQAKFITNSNEYKLTFQAFFLTIFILFLSYCLL